MFTNTSPKCSRVWTHPTIRALRRLRRLSIQTPCLAVICAKVLEVQEKSILATCSRPGWSVCVCLCVFVCLCVCVGMCVCACVCVCVVCTK